MQMFNIIYSRYAGESVWKGSVGKLAHTDLLRVEHGYGGKYKGNISTVNNSCKRSPLTMIPYRPKGHLRVG